ncbi:flagellar hook-associated protein FlgL, partial [Candidatus Riflebacteria bacterium]
MRITNSRMALNFLSDANRIREELELARERAATGKAFTRTSEAPQNAIQALQANAELFSNEQFQKNNSQATSFLQSTEGGISSLESALQRVRELMVQAANDTLVQEDRDAIAKEVDQLLRHVVDLANTDIAGEYIFGGSDTKTPPVNMLFGNESGQIGDVRNKFTGEDRIDVNHGNPTAFVYQGDDITYDVEIAKNSRLTKNIAGSELFFNEYPVASGPTLIEKTNVQISEATLLSSLNGGQFEKGIMRIVDPTGNEYAVDLSGANIENLGDVKRTIEENSPFSLEIDKINNEIHLINKNYTYPPGGTISVLERTNTAHNLGFGTDQNQNGAMVRGNNDPDMLDIFTYLSDFRGGEGIESGNIRVIDTNGQEITIDLVRKKRHLFSKTSIEASPGSITQGEASTTTLFQLQNNGDFKASQVLSTGTLRVTIDQQEHQVAYDIMVDTIDSVMSKIGNIPEIQGAFYDPDTGLIKVAAVEGYVGEAIKIEDYPSDDGNLADVFLLDRVKNYQSTKDIQSAPGALTAGEAAGSTLTTLKLAGDFSETSNLTAGDIILSVDGITNLVSYDPAVDTLNTVLGRIQTTAGVGSTVSYDAATGLVKLQLAGDASFIEIFDSSTNDGNLAKHLRFDLQISENPEKITVYNSAGDIQNVPGSISTAESAATLLSNLKTAGKFKETTSLAAGNLLLNVDQNLTTIAYDPAVDTIDAVLARVVATSAEISAAVYDSASGQIKMSMADDNNKLVEISDDPAADGNLAAHFNLVKKAAIPNGAYVNTLKDVQDQVRFATADQHIRLNYLSDAAIPLPGGHLEFVDLSTPPGTSEIKIVEETNIARDLGLLTEQVRADSIEKGHRFNQTNDEVDFVEYTFSGITGDHLLHYEYYDVERSNEVEIYVNGKILTTEGSITANAAYSGGRTILIPDSYLNDNGLNIIRFDETQPTYNNEEYGIRNVRLQGLLKSKDLSPNNVPAIRGEFDLQPAITRDTLIRDLNGGQGISLGRIRIRDKAGNYAVFDLSNSHTLGNLLDRLNDPTSGIYIEAKINALSNAIEIVDKNNGATQRLSVVEVDSNTATDLGLNQIVFDQSIVGKDLNPILSPDTLISSLRNNSGGIKAGKMYFENGAQTREIDFSDAVTVGDFLARINEDNSDFGMTAYIDPDGTRLNLSSDLGSNYIKARDVDNVNMASGLGLGGTRGIFQTFMDFRDSLYRNDGVTISNINLHNIDEDIERVLLTHTDVGVRLNRLEEMTDRLETSEITLNQILNKIEDVDLTEAIITLQQLQSNFQA